MNDDFLAYGVPVIFINNFNVEKSEKSYQKKIQTKS